MSSSTLVPVYHYCIVGGYVLLFTSVNHAHYIVRLISVSTSATW